MKCFAHPPRRRSWRAPLSPAVAAAIAIAALTALLAACSDSEPSGEMSAAAPDPDAPSVISHSASIDENNGQIVFVSVVLSAPARVAVEYENEFAGKFRTALSETAVEHAVPVVRLRASTAYRYAVGVEKENGELAYQARGEFAAGALPGILDTMRRDASGRSSQDLIILDYATNFLPDSVEQHIVIIDALGYPVWSYIGDAPADSQVSMNAIRLLPNGNIAYQLWDCCITEITPLGERVNGFAADRTHHDFLPLKDGRMLSLSARQLEFDDSANGGDSQRGVRVDAVNAINPATGESERVWDPMDFWDVSDRAQWGTRNPDRPDWLHMNSLEKSPGGGYIASLRNIDQVVSLSSDFKTVRWRLGGPDSDFDFPDPADRFTAQHTATELPNGNILVFDNRAELPEEEGGGAYSRALELRLDFESKTAVKAWEFSPEPRMYSHISSGAYRLDNGNTLINFGVSTDPPTIPIAIIEADAQGREVFRLATIDPPTAALSDGRTPYRYRAYPGPKSIMGETMLRPPKPR